MADIHYAPLTDSLGALHVHGPDADKFLQSQFSNDLLSLPRGAGQWSSYSTAKGRMIANFFLWRGENGLFLFLARDLVEEVAQRLRKFRMMAKAEIETVAADVWGLWGTGLDPAGLAEHTGIAALAPLPWPVPAALLLVSDAASVGDTLAKLPATATTANDWWVAAIRAGTGFITRASSEQIIPQELNLEVLGGINFKKGCYPGQEIVARSHYLGVLKRQCYLVVADVPLEPGQEVFAPSMGEQPVGMVINTATEGNEHLALVVLRAANASEPLHLGGGNGGNLRIGTLPYTLPLDAKAKE
ncbi:folate-binding protein [Candidatus Igneacidithiobacillus taiwanensis]|uniref:CAF17-like 4Fe-4S cluster assembly/insertion protein YgfZ n=1 Tax=Candidatus Igneacidithiobacillus taiwanensis TaxID=1945924 RepID=UPI0028A2B8AF|nr:folate-binding protein [Candidatus Igneacidithiobacillus taiwanensis]MCE5360460.1 folate-binding protein YgfZ [Acidithiobacillus sp.]